MQTYFKNLAKIYYRNLLLKKFTLYLAPSCSLTSCSLFPIPKNLTVTFCKKFQINESNENLVFKCSTLVFSSYEIGILKSFWRKSFRSFVRETFKYPAVFCLVFVFFCLNNEVKLLEIMAS